jgi:hypothetical protein
VIGHLCGSGFVIGADVFAAHVFHVNHAFAAAGSRRGVPFTKVFSVGVSGADLNAA